VLNRNARTTPPCRARAGPARDGEWVDQAGYGELVDIDWWVVGNLLWVVSLLVGGGLLFRHWHGRGQRD
jgi:hypothetical protein